MKPNKRLFNNLMRYADSPTTLFYYTDCTTRMGLNVRIFAYHAASAEHWIPPNALESRGIMFLMDEKWNPVRVLCRPMEKFFNAYENSLSNDINWDDALYYMTKEDGSLISSFDDDGYLGLKSHKSIYSDHVYWAMEWINGKESLKNRVHELALNDYTVNFEYVGPKNRIVVGYPDAALKILNVRNNSTGEYVEMDEIYADPILRPYMVDVFESDCSDEWYEKVRNTKGIEGYVVAFPKKFIKVKTKWYLDKFDKFNAINSNNKLATYCIDNMSDDIRAMYTNDGVAIAKITAFEGKYNEILSRDFNQILDFCTKFSHYDRKSFHRAASINAYKHTYLIDVMMLMYGGFNGDKCIEYLNKIYKSHQLKQFIPSEYI